jgi:pimeloyl-ACP methyl ester carboxylesterase
VGAGVGGLDVGDPNDPIYADLVKAEKAKDPDAVNEAEMKLWLVVPGRTASHVDKKLRDLFLDMNGIALRSDFDAAPTRRLVPPAAQRLGDIKAPTLVVVGDHDLPEVHETAGVLMSQVRGARKAVIHDAAHLPNLEHPEEFNRLLLDFLNG